jgi:hypothetical protein
MHWRGVATVGPICSQLSNCRIGVDAMSREVAPVTQGVYSAADRVLLKSEALSIWLVAVLPAYEAAKSDPRLTKAVEARKQSLADEEAERSGAKQPVGNTSAIPNDQWKPGKFAS